MIRIRVKEFVTRNAPDLTMTRLGILAGVSQKFIRAIWLEPANAHHYLDQLDTLAQALSDYLGREVSVCDLIETNNPPRS